MSTLTFRRPRARLCVQRQGFDASVRPSPAFSTLGYLHDRCLSTSLLGTLWGWPILSSMS